VKEIIDHWLYKIVLLKKTLENYEKVKDILQEGLFGVNKQDYLRMLKERYILHIFR